MRLKRIRIIGTIFPVLFSIVLFFGILIFGEDDDSSNSYLPVYSGMNLSADVLKHQPTATEKELATMSKTVCLLLYPAIMYFQNWKILSLPKMAITSRSVCL